MRNHWHMNYRVDYLVQLVAMDKILQEQPVLHKLQFLLRVDANLHNVVV